MNAPLLGGLTTGSTSVMAKRGISIDELDDFPTPPWGTRSLFKHVLPLAGCGPRLGTVLEPACNRGLMAEVIAEKRDVFRADMVLASDIADYGYSATLLDFTLPSPASSFGPVHWVITNPPFNKGLEFALRGLDVATIGVALLLRVQWAEGDERYRQLFRDTPPTAIAFFSERLPMVKGRWSVNAKSATGYAWFVWVKGAPRVPPIWIPPGQKKALTLPGDWLRFGACSDIPKAKLQAAAHWARVTA